MNLSKKNKLVIIILLVIAFGVGAIYAYVMKAPVKIESKKVDFTGTSDRLLLKILEHREMKIANIVSSCHRLNVILPKLYLLVI